MILSRTCAAGVFNFCDLDDDSESFIMQADVYRYPDENDFRYSGGSRTGVCGIYRGAISFS